MRSEFGPIELPITDLALYHDGRAFPLDVLEKLCTGHMLVLFLVADIAAKFGTLIHGVLLKIKHCLPDDTATFRI